MSTLSQFRNVVAIFALGTIWLSTEMVGEENKPGAIDSATRTAVDQLHSTDKNEAPQALQASSPSQTQASGDGNFIWGEPMTDQHQIEDYRSQTRLAAKVATGEEPYSDIANAPDAPELSDIHK